MHALCRPAQRTSDEEKRYGHQHDWSATKHIGQTATEWEGRGAGEPIGSTNPDKVVVAAEVMCNSRKYGRNGGNVEGAEDVANNNSQEAEPERGAFPHSGLGRHCRGGGLRNEWAHARIKLAGTTEMRTTDGFMQGGRLQGARLSVMQFVAGYGNVWAATDCVDYYGWTSFFGRVVV